MSQSQERPKDSTASEVDSGKDHGHGKFFEAVKTEIAVSDEVDVYNGSDETLPDPKMTPIERHGAKIHDLLRTSSKILRGKHTIHSFTELVSKAMSAAHQEPTETKGSMSNVRKKNLAKAAGHKTEEAPSKRLSRNIMHLTRITHFSIAEVANLIKMFHAFTSRSKTPGQMDRQLFREVFQKHFGIMEDIMLDHLFYYFDEDRQGYIGETQWVVNLSIVLRGTVHEHIDFCYEVYKLGSQASDDVGIKRPQVRQMLQGCFPTDSSGASEEDSNNHEVVDMALRRLGRHTLGYITVESFTNSVLANPLNMQALGNCLPDIGKVKTFMAMFAEDYNNFRSNFSLPNDVGFRGKKFLLTFKRRKV